MLFKLQSKICHCLECHIEIILIRVFKMLIHLFAELIVEPSGLYLGYLFNMHCFQVNVIYGHMVSLFENLYTRVTSSHIQ